MGADGILSVTPYYNKPTQEGLYQHYKAIARCGPLPIIVYSVQGRTGVNIDPATLQAPRRNRQHRRRKGSLRQHRPDGVDPRSRFPKISRCSRAMTRSRCR